MPNYILDDHDRIPIARRPLRVEVAAEGVAGAVALVARRGQAEDRSVLHPRPGVMILPRIDERTVVRVEPSGVQGVFPDGTVVTIRLITDEMRDTEPDVVTVQSMDVSGLAYRDLAAVDVDADRLVVSALNAVVDVVLGELAAAARSAARAVLGVDRVTDADAVHLVVGVDVSTSMAAAIAEGSVAAMIDVVAGLSHVVGFGRRLSVCLLGDRPTWLPDVPVTELAASTAQAITATGLGCGFHAAPPELRGAPRESTVMYVVTDGMPADVEELRRIGRPRRSGELGDVRHVVTIGHEGARLPGDPPATRFVPPPPGQDATAHLLGAPLTLAELISGLLVGCFPEGSDAAARVSR